MSLSIGQTVGGVVQGSYAPQVEQTNQPSVAAPEAELKITESTQQKKSDSSESESKDREPSNETIKKAIADINKRANGTEAVFGFHDKTNRVTIKLVDKESKETIKEFPAEETLDLIAKAWELAGLTVDEKR